MLCDMGKCLAGNAKGDPSAPTIMLWPFAFADIVSPPLAQEQAKPVRVVGPGALVLNPMAVGLCTLSSNSEQSDVIDIECRGRVEQLMPRRHGLIRLVGVPIPNQPSTGNRRSRARRSRASCITDRT